MKGRTHSTAAAAAAGHYVKEGDYWLETLQGEPSTLGFPFDGTPHRSGPGGMETFTFQWSGGLRERLETVSTGVPRRLQVVLTAAAALLLSRYQGNHDVVIGTTIYKQQIEADFINTLLPLRITIDAQSKVKAFLMHVRRVIAGAVENQNYPMEMLPARLNLSNERHRFPLFDCAVLLESLHDARYLRGIPLNMVILFQHRADAILGTVSYNNNTYSADTIERITNHLGRLLRTVLSDLDAPVTSVDLLEEEDRHRVLVEFNRTGAPFPGDKTLHQLFREQAGKSGDSAAVVSQGTITYGELNRRTDQLAAVLQAKGVQTGTIVGLMLDPSLEMIIALLGVLKAGGAYLPMDAQFPVKRIRYMLADSSAKTLVSEVSKVSGEGIETVDLAEIIGPIGPIGPILFNEAAAQPDQLAYVIYTSGTTGWPKGVMVEHCSVVNVVTHFARQYDVGNGTHVLQMSDYTFDASVLQVFGTLLHGAVLFMMEKQLLTDMPRLRRFIETRRIHIINFVPSVLHELLSKGEKPIGIRYVISGGEKLEDTVKNDILKKGYRLYNHYGPTETCIEAVTGRCSGRGVGLGKPIANTRIYIVDGSGSPLPVGVPGEIHIGGTGVARGYMNRPELTAEKFNKKLLRGGGWQPQPIRGGGFLEKSPPGRRRQTIYKTGDRARWLADGTIEFLGRIDQQVKIYGLRIELGEIESKLLRHEAVKEAAVVTGENENGEKFLCAYFTPADLDIPQLREFLSRELPAYMVPSYFVPMEALPRTSAGKVDRRSLPDPKDSPLGEKPYRPPFNESQAAILRIWAAALGREPETIGIDDDFFRLGGNSINILKVQNRINQQFGQDISMSHLFLHPTIRRLAAEISKNDPLKNTECIVRLNHAGNKKNMFIFHPLHGMVYPYKELSRLLANTYNVYGIQARGLTDSSAMPSTFEEMRDDYLKQVRSVQAQGPYILVGYCIGNIFAYEAVQKLEDSRGDVEKLVLLDISSRFVDYYTRYLRVKESAVNVLDKLLLSSREKKNNPVHVLAGDADVGKKKKQIENHIDNILKKHRYKRTIRAIRAPVWIIKAQDRKDPGLTEAYSRKMTEGKVVLKETPGDHETLFESPNVEKLAEILENI